MKKTTYLLHDMSMISRDYRGEVCQLLTNPQLDLIWIDYNCRYISIKYSLY